MCDKCEQYKAEILNLERRVEELEEQLDSEPEESFSETRRIMMEDRD